MPKNYILTYSESISLIRQDLLSISAMDLGTAISFSWPLEMPSTNRHRINEYQKYLQQINWKRTFSARSVSFECIGDTTQSIVVQHSIEYKISDIHEAGTSNTPSTTINPYPSICVTKNDINVYSILLV
eukprot:152620_1